jgi:DNA-binding PadR family transcriptional regulator
LADRSTSITLDALSRAAAAPDGLPLVGGKSGLFAASAAVRPLAERCKEDGFLRVLRTEAKGKSTLEICGITEKGLAYLLREAGPSSVLESLIESLERRGAEASALIDEARKARESLDALRALAERVLAQTERSAIAMRLPANGSPAWPGAALTFLKQRQERGAVGDCSLPELYRAARQTSPQLSIGQFHDGLRSLYERERIYLHPWSGPLYDLPEPALALLAGHDVAYYVSLRATGENGNQVPHSDRAVG